MFPDSSSFQPMQKAAAATLFCHQQLISLEQEQNMVSCKAKNKSGGQYQLNHVSSL
jgi:hypothetical protein